MVSTLQILAGIIIEQKAASPRYLAIVLMLSSKAT
jgi:hypothetical protein